MMRDILPANPLLALPMATLFLFLAIFVGVVVIVMRRGARGYQAVAELALNDDDGVKQQEDER